MANRYKKRDEPYKGSSYSRLKAKNELLFAEVQVLRARLQLVVVDATECANAPGVSKAESRAWKAIANMARKAL